MPNNNQNNPFQQGQPSQNGNPFGQNNPADAQHQNFGMPQGAFPPTGGNMPIQGQPPFSYNPGQPTQSPFSQNLGQQGQPNSFTQGNVPIWQGVQPVQNVQNGQIKPNKPLGKNNPKNTKPTKKKKGGSSIGWVLFGLFLMILIIVGGAYLGYKTAVQARSKEFAKQSVLASSEQYQLALQDIANEQYANAKTRLEWVLSVDPDYPGATEKYTEVVMNLFPKATPTPFYTPTPMPTATVDLRGEDEMFNGILSSMYASQWESAITQMDALRDKNLSYKSLEMDGLYYVALRSWGIQLISQGYLESGIYKITLAEAFGPIDNIADGQRLAARSYLAGSGFWEINWTKALEYYSTAYQSSPNLFDQATGLTAQQRYAEASFEVANLYIISSDFCGAIPYYDQGFLVGSDETIAITATAAYLTCYPAEPTAVPQAVSVDTGAVSSEMLQPDPNLVVPAAPGL